MFPPEGQKLWGVQTWGGIAMPPSATFRCLAPGKHNPTLSLPKDEGTVSCRKTALSLSPVGMGLRGGEKHRFLVFFSPLQAGK